MLTLPRASAALGTVALLSLGAATPRPGAAQACEFADGSRSYNLVSLPGGRRMIYLGTPHLLCQDGVEIWADSAVVYQTENWAHFTGNVRYLDEAREMESDEARYFTQIGRVQAEGRLVVRDTAQGSVIRHGSMVYLRQTEFRFEEDITVTTGADSIRPQLTFVPRAAPDTAVVDPAFEAAIDSLGVEVELDSASADSALLDSLAAAVPPDTVNPLVPETVLAMLDSLPPTPPVPFVVEGDRLEIVGGRFKTIGRVEVTRDDVFAVADSAEYDDVAGRMLLDGSARVTGASFDLSGRRIELAASTGGDLDEVRALRSAELVTDDVRLRAPEIRVHLTEGDMERLVAVRGTPRPPAAGSPEADTTAPARPVALAEEFHLTADSIEVIAPAEALERIFAAGNARSESAARDSLNVGTLPGVAQKDWLEGDTIVVSFRPVAPDPLAAVSGERSYELESLAARGRARSLYRLQPADSASRPGVDPPALHYVVGSEITIVMGDGEVERMEVEGLTQGVHLEPLRAAPTDTAAVGAATSARPDTLGLAPMGTPQPTQRPRPAGRPGGDRPSYRRFD